MEKNGWIKIISFGLMVTLIFNGCMKEQDCQKLSDEYFPNRIGNWWIYDRFDSLAMEQTKLRVDIVRDSVWKDGTIYKIWVFSKSNLYDTLFVRTKADSVLFYRYLDGLPLEVMLVPVSAGLAWVHPVWVRDSSRVQSKDALMIKSESYTNAYRIHRRLFAFNDYLTDDRWFVPNLGIVKLENWHYLFGWISKENWYLKDFGLDN